jgi:hypothetical protein
MAKILKSGNLVPMASLGKFAAASGVLVTGALMVAGWAASASVATGLFAGLLGSWPVGLAGMGVVAASGVWLSEGRPAHPAAGEAAINQGEVGNMANQVMVSPQVAFAMARVNK